MATATKTNPAKKAAGMTRSQKFASETRPALKKQLDLANIHQAPALDKIVVSVGLGKNKEDKKHFEIAQNTLRKITGRQPMTTYARKSIAGFKLREGNKLGYKVTLRGETMYEFLERLVDITLPRVRDFRGLSRKSVDAGGNYNIGFPDQTVFPEIDYDDMPVLHGIQITLVISSQNKEHSLSLLEALGVPLEKSKEETNG